MNPPHYCQTCQVSYERFCWAFGELAAITPAPCSRQVPSVRAEFTRRDLNDCKGPTSDPDEVTPNDRIVSMRRQRAGRCLSFPRTDAAHVALQRARCCIECPTTCSCKDPDVFSMDSICVVVRELQLHPTRGIPPSTTMRNWSLPFLRRQLLSTFREAPETRARKQAEVAPNANGSRVSGRNVCR